MVVAPERQQQTPERRVSRVWKWVAIALGVFLAIGLIGGALLVAADTDESSESVGAQDAVVSGDVAIGSGIVITEIREVAAFDGLVVTGEGEVTLRIADEPSLTLRTDDNLLPLISTDVTGSTLYIDTTESVDDIEPTDGVQIEITTPELSDITTTGAPSISIDGVSAGDFEIALTGAGFIDVDRLDATSLTVNATGAGTVSITGSVDEQRVVAIGAVTYIAGDLRSAVADIESMSVNNVIVWVTDELDASLLGVGSIEYFGSPTVTSDILGVGRLVAHGER